MMFAAVVAFACLIYMTIHTKSFFLGLVSILNVSMSIPISLCIYHYVFQVTYFSGIHISVFIIIIGIGSDDVFVFHDCWQNAFTIEAIRDKPVLRLSYAFRQAASTMLVTSLTSAVAFFACAFSAIMPVRSFGIFAAIVVPVCFLITIFV